MKRRRATQGGLVLIADGDLDRAKRMEQACMARGYDVHVVRHGAAALEAALAEIPDVLILPEGLPLIDAPKLAEILRSNPRTQAVRLVVLGEPGFTGTAAFADELLSPTSPADEVVQRVDVMRAQQARLEAMEQGGKDDREVEGKIAQIPLPDLLQLFHLNRKTGTIELERRDADGREERGRLYVQDGNVIQACVGSVEGEKALYRLLAWKGGSFAFTQNRVSVPVRIQTPTRALLMEGMRQLDEWERASGGLPALDGQVSLRVKSTELPNIVHPLTQEVLLLLEIYSRVQEIVDHCSYPDYQVLRTLQTLVERGIVQIRRTPSVTPTHLSEALFTAAQARRLREWTDSAGGRPGGADAKLLLLSSQREAMRAFLGLFRGLPGAQLDPAVDERGGAYADDALQRLGRIAVDAGCGIELVHVPTRAELAPLWRVAGQRALGSLLLLEAPVAEAAERIRRAAETLRSLPRARTFYVMLLRKGERALPEELRENLSLLDEGSLFLVPLESGKEPRVLLRSLLARILP
jgi:CheY-like chemotaxis protein